MGGTCKKSHPASTIVALQPLLVPHGVTDSTVVYFHHEQLVEMLRRFVLVGLMVLAQGSMVQLIMGTLLSAVFLLFQVQAAPYKDLSDDYLASASSFSLVILFICRQVQIMLIG